MFMEQMEADYAAQSGEEQDAPAPRQTQAEASKKFAETGETSLAREPVDADYTGMDAFFAGKARNSKK